MSPIYFLPGVKDVNAAILDQFRLGGLIDRPTKRETFRGPDDLQGMLCCQSGSVKTLRFDPNQKWSKRFGTDAYVGIDPESPVTPESLQRPTQIAGQRLTLFDGQSYVIPQLRCFDVNQIDGPLLYSCNLDRMLTQDTETGRMVPGEVVPQYRDVWNDAIKIGDRILDQLTRGQSSASLAEVDLHDFAIKVLGLNYRLEKPEVTAANLLTLELSSKILNIAIDTETMRANLGNRLRRRASGGSRTESGVTPQTAG
ncbi:hypothetical protein RMSM_02567 [Rhodopirellula maiorica SM1]|uniref:Uncharacterized protein n=1 Tax=Rhodopirellula maiorica SM1 TaxID=1265738 RepID=M5RMK3_9BACT|nr:hypothetical protein [Rhodopirellula maiorica]EMI20535.1 hypothetical protein RMSM_02567 [Rhodopirellula maiorica SM1]